MAASVTRPIGTPSSPIPVTRLRANSGYSLINYRDEIIRLGDQYSMDNFIISFIYAERDFLMDIKKEAKLVSLKIIQMPPEIPIRGTQCSISLEDIKQGETYDICTTCKNVFKSSNLTTWIKQSCTCPICRTPIQERIQSTIP